MEAPIHVTDDVFGYHANHATAHAHSCTMARSSSSAALPQPTIKAIWSSCTLSALLLVSIGRPLQCCIYYLVNGPDVSILEAQLQRSTAQHWVNELDIALLVQIKLSIQYQVAGACSVFSCATNCQKKAVSHATSDTSDPSNLKRAVRGLTWQMSRHMHEGIRNCSVPAISSAAPLMVSQLFLIHASQNESISCCS